MEYLDDEDLALIAVFNGVAANANSLFQNNNYPLIQRILEGAIEK